MTRIRRHRCRNPLPDPFVRQDILRRIETIVMIICMVFFINGNSKIDSKLLSILLNKHLCRILNQKNLVFVQKIELKVLSSEF